MSDGLMLIPRSVPPVIPRQVSGGYYDLNTLIPGSVSAGSALGANQLYATWLYVPAGGQTYTAVQISVTATGTATEARVGFYLEGADGQPGDLILELGSTFNVSGTGDKEVTQTFALPGGIVHPVILLNGTCTVHAYGTLNASLYGYTSASSTSRRNTAARSTYPYAALPSTFGTPTGLLASGGPRISVKV